MDHLSPDGLLRVLRMSLSHDHNHRAVLLGAGSGEMAGTVARLFTHVVAVEPDPHLAPAGMRIAAAEVEWIEAAAEEVELADDQFDAAFLGPSFQWMDRPLIAARLFRALRPGGHVIVVAELEDDDAPSSRPLQAIEALVAEFAPTAPRSGRHRTPDTGTGDDAVLAEAGFTGPDRFVAQRGGAVIRDVETMMAHVYAHTHTAPHLFGYDIAEFDTRLRAVLTEYADEDGGLALPRPALDVRVWTRG